ncbi:hypothetical protein ACFL5Q_07400 [Planctomycetota bacterium]
MYNLTNESQSIDAQLAGQPDLIVALLCDMGVAEDDISDRRSRGYIKIKAGCPQCRGDIILRYTGATGPYKVFWLDCNNEGQHHREWFNNIVGLYRCLRQDQSHPKNAIEEIQKRLAELAVSEPVSLASDPGEIPF